MVLYDPNHAMPAGSPRILLGSGRSHLGVAPLASRSSPRSSRAGADTGPEAKQLIQQEGLLAASSNSKPAGARLPLPQRGQVSAETVRGQQNPPKGLPAVSNSRRAVEACSQPQQREQAPSRSRLAGQAGPWAAEQQHVHQQVLAESSSSKRHCGSSQRQEPVPLRSPVTGQAAPGDTVPDTPVSSRARSLSRGSGGSQGLLPTQDGMVGALQSQPSQPGKASQPGEAAPAGHAQSAAQPAAQPAAACQKSAAGTSSGGRQASEQAVPSSAAAAAEAPAQGLHAATTATSPAASARPVAAQLQGVPAAFNIAASARAQAVVRPLQPGQGQQQQQQDIAALPLPAAGPNPSGSGALGQMLRGTDAAAAMSLTPAACPRAAPWPQEQSAGAAIGLGKRKQPEVACTEASTFSRTDTSDAAGDSFRQGQSKRAAVGPQQQRGQAPPAGSLVAAVRPAQPVTPARKSPGPAKAGRGASKPSRLQSSSGAQSEGAHLGPRQQQAVVRGQAAPTDAQEQQGKADSGGLAAGVPGQLQWLQAGTAGWAAATPQGLQAPVEPPAEVREPPPLVDDPVGAAAARLWQQGPAGNAVELAAAVRPHQQGPSSPLARNSATPARAAQAAAAQRRGVPASSPAGTTRGFLSRPDPNPYGLRPGRASLLGAEVTVVAQAAAGGAGVALAGAQGPSTAPLAVNRWAHVYHSWAASGYSGVWLHLIQLPLVGPMPDLTAAGGNVNS